MNVYVNSSEVLSSESYLELALARELLQKQKLEDARLLFQQVAELTCDPEALYGLAVCEFELKHLEAALKVVQELLDLQPEHADAFNLAGAVSMALGHVSSARSMFKAALDLDGDLIQARRNLAETMFMEWRYLDGINAYLAILRDRPGDVPSMMRLAELFDKADKRDLAMEYRLRALRYSPDNDVIRSAVDRSLPRLVYPA